MNDTVSIRLDGSGITSEVFLRAVSNFFKVAKNVSEETAGHDNYVEWEVKVKEGSNVVVGLPKPSKWRPNLQELLVTTIVGGIASIMNGNPSRPDHFNDSALDGVRAIAAIGIERIEIFSDGATVRVDSGAVGTVDTILGSAHKSFGEVEGKLAVLSDQHGFKFSIFEPTIGKEVTCYIQKEDLIEKAVQAFRRRVSVIGLIKYRRDGSPLSIDVDDIRVFGTDSHLPSVDDVIGIYKRQ